MSADLATRIRALAADAPATIAAELLAIAVPVGRMEVALDDIAADAMQSATVYVERSLTQERAREARRRRACFVVVGGRSA